MLQPETPFDPEQRLDLEFELHSLIGGLRGLSSLLANARTIDFVPGDFSCLIDLHVQKAETVQRLAGF